MQSEQDLKRRVIATLKNDYPGCWIWKISDQWTSGIPDVLFIYQGVHIFMELKSERGKLSKLQDHTLHRINAAGGHAWEIRSVEDARRIVQCQIQS